MITVTIVSIGLLAVAFCAGYTLQAGQRQIADNAVAEIEVSASAVDRTPSLPPSIATLQSSPDVVVSSWIPEGAQRAVITDVPIQVANAVPNAQPLIAVSGTPVFGLEISLQPYRDMRLGMSGPDIAGLNAALSKAGYAVDANAEKFDTGTQEAIAQMFQKFGYIAPGDPAGATLPLAQIVRLTSTESIVSKVSSKGAEVSIGSPIFEAVSPVSEVTVRVDVVSSEELSNGTVATIDIPGLSDSQRGTVVDVSEFREADGTESGSDFPGKDVRIRLDVPLTGVTGAVASVKFSLDSEPKVAVPLLAIRSDSGSEYVERRDTSGEYKRVDVEVSSEESGWALLASGSIAAGDTVRITP